MSLRLILCCFLAFAIVFLFSEESSATHNRAGEILFEQIPGQPLSYRITIITYTDPSGGVDRDFLTLDWEGGATELPRVNGIPGGPNNVPQGEMISPGLKYNEYKGTITYNGIIPADTISMTDPNRIASIININGGNSVLTPFYLESIIRMYDFAVVGSNSSPVLTYAPVDTAGLNQLYFHNPGAYDADGDSLHYQLVPPLQAQGSFVPNYEFPDEVSPGPDNNFTINENTGDIVWDSPKQTGIYNIAILIREYRDGILMGSILRDMQIIVIDMPNQPPVIEEFEDTCLVAGLPLDQLVFATDPDAGQFVTLEASGGPFVVDVNPAEFFANNGVQSADGLFTWQTVCEHARRQPYQVVFRAKDDYKLPNGLPAPLTYLKSWRILIVAPPPENLVATPVDNTVELEWDANYACDHLSRFRGFSVWRREGSNPFLPDTCDTGLADKGYVMIENGVTGNSYVDEDVVPGKLYCYRIRAEFALTSPAGFTYNAYSSMPSNESCGELRRDVPIITNVSVTETDQATGEMYVAWTNPLTGPDDLDTLQFPGPYTYNLYRSEGFTGANLTQIATFTAATFSGLVDTTYSDTGLNTEGTPYSYSVEFLADNDVLIGETEIASSIYLSFTPSNEQLTLEWEKNVPWLNDSFYVFRFDPGLNQYEQIATVFEPTYTDYNLVNDSTYCYYVQSIGGYSGSNAPTPLINLSQESCAEPNDTIPPCRPFLAVTNLCDELPENENFCAVSDELNINNLRWNDPNLECEYKDAISYQVYFSRFPDGQFERLDSITDIKDTTYQHLPEASLAGCYAVTAIDSAGNESDFSNIVCVDNCPCYVLPNTFTPNNDQQNDLFTPILPYRFIDRIDFKVYNRWGEKVFETEDPMINWDGTHERSGRDLEEGVYYYVATIFEKRLEGASERSERLSGYIHLFR